MIKWFGKKSSSFHTSLSLNQWLDLCMIFANPPRESEKDFPPWLLYLGKKKGFIE